MMNQAGNNPDWGALSSSWQSIDEQPRFTATWLKEHVHREDRRLRIWRVFETLLSVAVIGGTVGLLVLRPDTSGALLAIDTWVVLAVVWFFALTSDRGLWRPATLSTAEYLALARRYAQRRLHTVYLALALLLGQIIVLVALALVDNAYRGISYIQVISVIAWLVWATWAWRRALTDLDTLNQLGQNPDM